MTTRNSKSIIFATLVFLTTGPFGFGQRDKKRPEVPLDVRKSQAEATFAEGEKYFILEDFTKALLYFQKASELNPLESGAYYKLAEVLAKSGIEEDLKTAAFNIEKALKLEKKNKYYYQLASSIYAGLGEFQKARSTMEMMMKESKAFEEDYFELAALYLIDNQKDQALTVYSKAQELFGISEVGSLQRQKILLEQGKMNEGIAEGENLIEAFPDEERILMGFAETLATNKQRTRAISYLEKFVIEHENSGNAKLLLAGLYKDDGAEQKSRDLLLAIFDDPAIEPRSKVIVIGAYNAMIRQNQQKKIPDIELEKFALGLFLKLAASIPNDPNVHIVGGDLYLSLNQNQEAREEYSKAIALETSSFEAWQNLLYLESKENLLDSLIVHSEKGLELFPNQAILHYFNGFAHLKKRHYREASVSLEQAKKLSSSNPELLGEINGMLGDAYNGIRDYQKSDKAYEEALAVNPNNDVVLNNFSYFLAMRKDNLEKAEKMSSLLIKNHPENPTYLDTHAWVLYTREKFKEARKVIERAISTGKASAAHYEHYGDILFQLGAVDEAVSQWEKAKSLSSNHEALNKKIANRKLN